MMRAKLIQLVTIAAAALLAFAGTASATYLTSPAETTYTGTVKAQTTSFETHPGSGTSFLTIKCGYASFEWSIQNHGAGVTASGSVTSLIFTECGNDVVTVLKAGAMEVHGSATTGDGTLTWTGGEIRMHTSEGPVCTFKSSPETDIGTVTGGAGAELDLESAAIPASGFLCPSFAIWTGSFNFTSPETLDVH